MCISVRFDPDEDPIEVTDADRADITVDSPTDAWHHSARRSFEQFCGVESTALPFADTYVPAPGELVYYLVTLTNSRKTYEGSLGEASDGSLRLGANPCQ